MKFIRKHFFLVMMTLFTLVYTYVDTGIRYDFIVLSLFLGIGLFSLYGLFLSIDSHPISLNKTFCLFFYFFFSIAPITQFKHNLVFFVQDKFISDSLYSQSGSLLLGVLLVYLLFYRSIYSYLMKGKKVVREKIKNDIQLVNSTFLIFFSAFSVFLYLYLIKFNWDLLIFRPFIFRLKYNTNLGLLGYAILLVVQLTPFVCFMHYKLRNSINDKNTFTLLFLMVLVCFPSSLPRGIIGMLYIPLCLLFIPILNKKKYYIKMYLLGLLLAFPLLNNFRHLYEGKFRFNYQLFDTAHFDSFQNLAFLIDEQIITNGRQLLGSIFFFIQESRWHNRPMGTGTLLAEKLGYSYTNVDMSFFGEGYANFGFLGVFVFVLLITVFNAFLDYRYAQGRLSNLLLTIFYIFLGFEFYLLRGDLYSSIKIMSSFGLAIGLVELSCYFYIKWRGINE